ncbi:MAG: hypothetical protein IID03_12105 [Candidatus Dadabacteria bacterium]|nr:hypothetical protein [Candidatus Dadabacteria bacterium]
MSVKRLSTHERISLVDLAQKKGVSFAAKERRVNRKTVYYWIGKSRKGTISDLNSSKVISEAEREKIIRLAKYNGFSTIREFIGTHAIKYSFTTVYNILSSSNIPIRSQRILIYLCSGCNKSFKALHLYIGKANAPGCPSCHDELKIKNGWKLYFLGSLDNYLLSKGGELKPLTNSDASFIRRTLKPPISYFPKYLDSTDQKNRFVTHIVSVSSAENLTGLCGIFPLKRQGVIYSALSGALECDHLCNLCVEEANILLRKGKKLEPKFNILNRRKRKEIENAIELAEIIKNIAEACRIYNLSRTTYYMYKTKKSTQTNLPVGRLNSKSI